MTDTRFLSPELRKRYAENMLDMSEIMEFTTFALHDLDVADTEIETLRLQLAGCSTAATANTPEATAQRITKNNPYWSAAYQDVCDAVDREIALREEVAKLTQSRDRLQSYLDNELCDLRLDNEAKDAEIARLEDTERPKAPIVEPDSLKVEYPKYNRDGNLEGRIEAFPRILAKQHNALVTQWEIEGTILRAEIARLQSFIDNELCDIRLDNEAKSAEIAHLYQKQAKERSILDEHARSYGQEIAELQSTEHCLRESIAELKAVIAAMKKWLSDWVADNSQDLTPEQINELADFLNQDAMSQLAADHDAAIRADERRKVLEEAAQIADRHWTEYPSMLNAAQEVADELRQLATPKEVI